MACTACLNNHNPAARYCGECGGAFTEESHAAADSPIGGWSDRPRRCAECGASIAAGARFCIQCGVSAVEEHMPSSRLLLGVGVSIAAAIVTFSTLFLQFYGGK